MREVRVDHERGPQLVVLVAEVNGGVVPARHFDPSRLAVWDVCSKQVIPAKHMDAIDARVTGTWVAGSRGDEAAQVFDQCVVTVIAVGE